MKQLTITVLLIAAFLTAAVAPILAGKPILWGPIRHIAMQTVRTNAEVQKMEAEGYVLTCVQRDSIQYAKEPTGTYNWGSVVFVYAKRVPDSCEVNYVYVTVNIEVTNSTACSPRCISATSLYIK